jgi:hypothetical protein
MSKLQSSYPEGPDVSPVGKFSAKHQFHDIETL